jgi:hypothetical protein
MSSCVFYTQQFSFSQYVFIFFPVFFLVDRNTIVTLAFVLIYGCITFTIFIPVILNFGNTIPL